MQQFLFESLVAPLEDVVYLEDGPVSASHCFSASAPMPAIEAHVFSVSAMRAMRHRISIAAQGGGRAHEAKDRLYISRTDSDSGDRQFHNIAEAEAVFARHGFEKVVASDLDVEQTLATFRQCRLVIGVHGAGLMNALFSSEKARVVELLDYPGSWNSIHTVLSGCGLQADRISALAPTPASGGLPLIDLETVDRLLSSLT